MNSEDRKENVICSIKIAEIRSGKESTGTQRGNYAMKREGRGRAYKKACGDCVLVSMD